MMRIRLAACLTCFLFSSISALVLAQDDPALEEQILPIVVNGQVESPRHFQMTFHLINPGAEPVEVRLSVFDNEGNAASGFLRCDPVPRPDPQGELMVEVPALGAQHLTGFTDSDLISGWARLRAPADSSLQVFAEISLIEGPPRVCGVICTRPSTELVSSAAVPGVLAGTGFRASGTITRFRHSGYAIVNPSETEPAKINLTVRHNNGERFDSSEFEVPPLGRISMFLFELVNLGKVFIQPPQPPEMFHGTAEFTSDRPVAVGGLNILFPEGKFVELPVALEP